MNEPTVKIRLTGKHQLVMDAISKLDAANEITKCEAGTGFYGTGFTSQRVSIKDIARATKYDFQEVASIVRELIAQGLVFRGLDVTNRYGEIVRETFTLRADRAVTNN